MLAFLYAVVAAIVALPPGPDDCSQPPPDLRALGRNIRETLAREYAAPLRFTYLENRADIDVSTLGAVTVGPLRTFEVYPTDTIDEYKRLVAIEGKPLDAAELALRDAEHQRNVQRRAAESPQRRAARVSREAEEIRDRDAILDDAAALFELGFACREVLDGNPVIALTMTPRQHARVTTREGSWMKKTIGRMWVSEDGSHIARVRLQTVDAVSVGWGVVARIETGSYFDYVRTRIGDTWLPSKLTMEGSGRTLLFRSFHVKTVTTYTNHKRYAGR